MDGNRAMWEYAGASDFRSDVPDHFRWESWQKIALQGKKVLLVLLRYFTVYGEIFAFLYLNSAKPVIIKGNKIVRWL